MVSFQNKFSSIKFVSIALFIDSESIFLFQGKYVNMIYSKNACITERNKQFYFAFFRISFFVIF